MSTEEFSNEFDTLINAYGANSQSANMDLFFDEYEKSVFLTKAQEELVLGLYTGKTSTGESFESTEEMRRSLASLISESVLAGVLKPITTTSGSPLGIESNSRFFTLPPDLWFITYESAKISNSSCANKNTIKVYPTKQDEYHSIKDNPFRGANSRRALRFDLSDGIVEIVSKLPITEYYIRYLKKLTPIILIDLPEGLKIDDISTQTECTLDSSLHSKILEMAVLMALRSKSYGIQNKNSN